MRITPRLKSDDSLTLTAFSYDKAELAALRDVCEAAGISFVEDLIKDKKAGLELSSR